MRQGSDGRSEVPPWSVAQRVYGAIDSVPGTVVSVEPEYTITVRWDDGSFPVVYNSETIMVREAWPWES